MSIQSSGYRSEKIRSGRFSSATAKTTPLVIIDGRSGAFYRILNSGPNKFDVDAGVGNNTTTTLDLTLSLDVAVSGQVRIVTAADVPIEGIYEYLNTERPIRSGRFKVTLAANTRHKIIDLARGGSSPVHLEAYYRVFNSGAEPFFVQTGPANSTKKKQVDPDQSYDFDIPRGARDIWVFPVNATKEIEGIYDFLGQE